MDKNNGNFSINDAMRLAQSDAGRQLMELLQAGGSEKLQNIMALASQGNMQQAAQQLSHMLQSEEAKSLLAQLGGENHE